MSLEYKKRLMELRRYAEQELNPNSDGISTKPNFATLLASGYFFRYKLNILPIRHIL